MRWASALCLIVCFSTPAPGQDRPILVSPEVRGDRTVVFRLWAPQAVDIQLSGSWMGPKPPVPLIKSPGGVWTVAVGPLAPNIYSYGFLVDGVRASDPSCRCAYTSAGRFSESRFTIPSESPQSWESQNRPPGTLHHEQFFSARHQRMRRFVVYTPPGYEPSAVREYPLLILLPGTPGDELDWTSGGGFADVMFDNLIAEGRMVPMVVAMHASDVLDPPDERRGDENLRALETVLVNELVPVVRRQYRVSKDPQLAAIAGLSLGGEFGMYVGLNHPEVFRTVASLSGSFVPSSFDRRFGPALAEAAKGGFQLIWLACGDEDIFFSGNRAFAGRLEATKIPHIFREFSGPHIMPVFRQELAELLPLLFR